MSLLSNVWQFAIIDFEFAFKNKFNVLGRLDNLNNIVIKYNIFFVLIPHFLSIWDVAR